MPKTYVLLKDLPDCNAGSLAIWDEKSNAYRIEKTGTWVSPHRYLYYSAGTVQFTPEWFTIKEEKIEVISINQYTDYSPNYVINLNQDIPPDKYPSIKKAIEFVLNNDDIANITNEDLGKCLMSFHKVILGAEQQAFEQSRLTHPMIGFKYKDFNDYKNSTK